MNRSQQAGHAGPETVKAIYRVSFEVRIHHFPDDLVPFRIVPFGLPGRIRSSRSTNVPMVS